MIIRRLSCLLNMNLSLLAPFLLCFTNFLSANIPTFTFYCVERGTMLNKKTDTRSKKSKNSIRQKVRKINN